MARLAAVVAAVRVLLDRRRTVVAGDMVLVQAVVTAVIAHGRRCGWYPDRQAVVLVRLASGRLVAVCSQCTGLLLPGEAAGCRLGVSVR